LWAVSVLADNLCCAVCIENKFHDFFRTQEEIIFSSEELKTHKLSRSENVLLL
jgi:hypothetical protein